MAGKLEVRGAVRLREFLMNVGPPATRVVLGALTAREDAFTPRQVIAPKMVEVYCEDEACTREMRFETKYVAYGPLNEGVPLDIYLHYTCRHCHRSTKAYAVRFRLLDGEKDMIEATKVGEVPSFGPPSPPRLFSLVGLDKELFLKGRRAENSDLGIGAFTYYRRVVENQKNRLLDEIISVAKRTGAKQEAIDLLESAKIEGQFARAIDDVKDAIPRDLLIKGHNPLTLLYRPLSEGIHDRTDEECLEMARSIRVVLAELAERMSHVLQDRAELDDSVARLLKGTGNKTDATPASNGASEAAERGADP